MLGFHALSGRISIARTAGRLQRYRQCLTGRERQHSGHNTGHNTGHDAGDADLVGDDA